MFVAAALAVAAVAVAGVSYWDARTGLGVAAGVAWNLASFWCLARLLQAWLGPRPSTRRAVAWLLLKFPLLYGAAVLLLRSPSLSILGFGVGFTLILLLAVGWAVVHARQMVVSRS